MKQASKKKTDSGTFIYWIALLVEVLVVEMLLKPYNVG